MAFSVFPTRLTNRRDKVEELLAKRRNREADFRQTWENNMRYFKNSDLNSQKHMALTSPESQQQSLEAFRSSKLKEERELWLNERRSKLSSLLRHENEKYEEEVKMMLSGSRHHKQSQESVLDDESERKLSTMPKETSSRGVQFTSNNSEKLEHEDSGRIPVNAKCLVDELKAKETKAGLLKVESRCLHENLQVIGSYVVKRAEIQQRLKVIPWSNRLSMPYKVLIKMKGQEMVNFFKSEMSLTNALLQIASSCIKEDFELSSIKKDIYAVKDVMQSYMEEEQRHITETELLYHEEAAALWNLRNEEWERKQHESDYVVSKIFNCLKTAIEAQLGDVLHKQKVCLDDREKLLGQLQQSALPNSSS